MPTIMVFCRDVYTLDQRRAFVKGVCEKAVESLKVRPEQVTVRLIRSGDEDISRAGVFRIDQPNHGDPQ
jgi:hypothetical protein